LAIDVSLAALLGEDVYSFGELLLHPIVNALKEGGFGWLNDMLACFNSGNICSVSISSFDLTLLLSAQMFTNDPSAYNHD
jgi:hypothetical protein